MFPKKLLELFSGSGSIGKAFRSKGWDVVSLDMDPKTDADIHEDILTWDYKSFPVGEFDAIWASPCCTQYSCARTSAATPRNLDLADSLVKRSLEIIAYFEPKTWFLENPATGMLKDRPFMAGIPYVDLDYCCYCAWGYRKRTRIWTDCSLNGKLCAGAGGCPNMVGKRHRSTAQQGKNKTKEGMHGETHSTRALYRVPPFLCDSIEHHAAISP